MSSLKITESQADRFFESLKKQIQQQVAASEFVAEIIIPGNPLPPRLKITPVAANNFPVLHNKITTVLLDNHCPVTIQSSHQTKRLYIDIDVARFDIIRENQKTELQSFLAGEITPESTKSNGCDARYLRLVVSCMMENGFSDAKIQLIKVHTDEKMLQCRINFPDAIDCVRMLECMEFFKQHNVNFKYEEDPLYREGEHSLEAMLTFENLDAMILPSKKEVVVNFKELSKEQKSAYIVHYLDDETLLKVKEHIQALLPQQPSIPLDLLKNKGVVCVLEQDPYEINKSMVTLKPVSQIFLDGLLQ